MQKIGLLIIVVIFSQVLYGQSEVLPSDDELDDFAVQIALTTVPTSTPFSYSAVREVTRFHFDRFLRDISSAGWNIQVWNTVEYSNIIHALEMNTGEMLRYGDILLVLLANLNPNNLSQLLAYFLTDEKLKKRKIIGAYLQDISFDFQTKTMRSFTFTVRMDDNHTANLIFECDDHCNTKIQEEIMRLDGQGPCDDECQERENGHNLLYNQILIHLTQGLFQSFEELLITEGVSKNSKLTLYLKDLSQAKETVNTFNDVERINIGVIVENSKQEFLKELDWIIQVKELKFTTNAIRDSISTPFHEAAHEVARRVLFGDVYDDIYRTSILIRNGLIKRDRWNLTHGYAYIAIQQGLSRSALMNSTNDYIKEMAITLAGLVFDKLFLKTDFNYSSEILEAQVLAFHGICSGMSLNGISGRDDCPSFGNLEGFMEFFEKLPEDEKQLWIKEAISWQLVAARLVAQVLTNHLDVLKQLTSLILLDDTLNHQDLQNFYQDVTLSYPSFLEVLNRSEDSSKNKTSSLIMDFGPDILNRQLTSLFSLDRQRNLEKVKQSSIPDMLLEVEKVEIPYTYLSKLSKQDGPSHIQRNYSQGLPALYIRECIRILLSHIK